MGTTSPNPDPQHDVTGESAGDVTRLLEAIRSGDESSEDVAARLVPLMYRELHELASRQRGVHAVGWTLQPTALVNELYLKLAVSDQRFEDRRHVLAVAAIAMRQVVVDHARRAGALKRGGAVQHVTITDLVDETAASIDIIDLEAAFQKLERSYERPAKVAVMRLYAGLSLDEIALALDVSVRTVNYDWRFARAHLQRSLAGHAE